MDWLVDISDVSKVFTGGARTVALDGVMLGQPSRVDPSDGGEGQFRTRITRTPLREP